MATPKKTPSKKQDQNGHNERMFEALSTIVTRAAIMGRLGKSYDDDRDVYEALGYLKNPLFDDYLALYRRADIASRVIEAPVKAAYFGKGEIPEVIESEDEDTPFEEAWGKLVKERSIWHYLARAEIVARIGRYGVLFLGVNDGRPLEEPIERATELLYLAVYAESSAQITAWVEDRANPRYGLPLLYTLQATTRGGTTGTSQSVHWSRVIHLAGNKLDSEVYGQPALERILNRLKDLELMMGGGAEGVWRGAFPGTAFVADANANLSGQALADLIDEIEEYSHGFKRYMRLKGIEPKQLMPQVTADISRYIDSEVAMIAATTGIPKRILMGSERGELASTQDERAWWDQVAQYRLLEAGPNARAFITRLVDIGILPAAETDYIVSWPALSEASRKDEADIAAAVTRALADYVSAPGADMIIPPDVFLAEILNFSKEQIGRIESRMGEIVKDADGEGGEEEEDEFV